jgi:glycyl-tRNA synthetase
MAGKKAGKSRNMQEESKYQEKKTDVSIDELTSFCKRRGFAYLSGEIYGGFSGFWDYGPLGVEMKNNLKKEWWSYHVHQREDVIGIDGSIITHPKVWKASGHVDSFSDVFVVCKKCKKAGKVDKSEIGKVKCLNCGGEYDFANAKDFHLMFQTIVGADTKAYLRPETAQLIFADFKQIVENARLQLPFGIAQIGKAFRNEIAPRDFLFRCREFEQMEIEYFVDPKERCLYDIGDSEILVYSAELQEKNKDAVAMSFKDALKKKIVKTDWHAYWLEQEFLWFVSLGASPEKFRIRQHLKDEKSHYALDTWDLEYKFPFGWKELQGMANRTDFDLQQHQKVSKKDLSLVQEGGKRIVPHVVCEPSQGVERAFLVFLFDSYNYDKERGYVVLKLHQRLAPYKAAVLPLVKRDDFRKIADGVIKDLRKEFNVLYDEGGSIGRRYARNDEAGTPYCITIDDTSLKNKDVTIRDRDTTEQIRVKISDLHDIMRKLISEELKFLNAGEKVK